MRLRFAASRSVSLSEARRQASEDHERLLPQGVRTPGHYLWTAYEGDEPVGDLWLHVETRPDGRHAFGYGIEVRPELRRRGYGRAITAAAEQKCREMNIVSIGLTVFGPTRRHKACMRTWALRSPCCRCASTSRRPDRAWHSP